MARIVCIEEKCSAYTVAHYQFSHLLYIFLCEQPNFTCYLFASSFIRFAIQFFMCVVALPRGFGSMAVFSLFSICLS